MYFTLFKTNVWGEGIQPRRASDRALQTSVSNSRSKPDSQSVEYDTLSRPLGETATSSYSPPWVYGTRPTLPAASGPSLNLLPPSCLLPSQLHEGTLWREEGKQVGLTAASLAAFVFSALSPPLLVPLSPPSLPSSGPLGKLRACPQQDGPQPASSGCLLLLLLSQPSQTQSSPARPRS